MCGACNPAAGHAEVYIYIYIKGQTHEHVRGMQPSGRTRGGIYIYIYILGDTNTRKCAGHATERQDTRRYIYMQPPPHGPWFYCLLGMANLEFPKFIFSKCLIVGPQSVIIWSRSPPQCPSVIPFPNMMLLQLNLEFEYSLVWI